MGKPAIDIEAFTAAPLQRDPYDFIIVPGFVRSDAMPAIQLDYPEIGQPGSFPLESLYYGESFRALVQDVTGEAMTKAFSEKFGVDLAPLPVMVTVRGKCGAKDGRIHPDTDTKVLTVLVYMNLGWEHSGGRLRVLRSADDLDDFAAEIPPQEGTLFAFRRSAHSFHGHSKFIGPRQVVQFNWVTDEAVVYHELRRHKRSAMFKRLNPFS